MGNIGRGEDEGKKGERRLDNGRNGVKSMREIR